MEKIIKIESSMPISLDDIQITFGNGDDIPNLKVTELTSLRLDGEKGLSFADYCVRCYGRSIREDELLPVSYSFAQANYTQYLAALSLSSDGKASNK